MSTIIEAVVQVGAEETRYLRCGRGCRAMIVLAETDAARSRLMARFGEEYRVIAPLVDAQRGADPRLQVWLRGIIDGLGLERPVLALCAGLGSYAARLAGDCGDVLDLVLTVPHEEG